MTRQHSLACFAGIALSAVAAGCGSDDATHSAVSNDALTGPTATFDATNVYFQVPISATPTWARVFVDADRDAGSGFQGYGIGAEYLFENGNLYHYSGSGGGWGWTRLTSATYSVGCGLLDVTIARADLGSPTAFDFVTQTDPPLQTSAKLTLSLSATNPTPAPVPTPAPTPTPTPGPTQITGPAYWVSPSGNDSNPGTQASPWRTIQKAADTAVAGDTVVLLDGTYEEGSINFAHSGTAAKPITFEAQNKWQAVLSSTSGCQPGLSIYASYITVKNLRITVSPRNSNCGTYTSANAHIRAWNSVPATPSNPTTGYVGFIADGVKVEGGTLRSVGLKSNQDFTIIQNSESDVNIELFGSREAVVRNNVITGQDIYGTSILAKGGVRNAQIYNNVVHNKVNNGQPFIIGGYSCDSCFFDTSAKIEAYNSVAYNNVAINESGGAMVGLMFQGATDSAFFNNVVIGGQLAMTVGGHNTGFQAPTTNPTFQNNIVLCNGASVGSGYAGWSYAGTATIDYNDFYGCSNTPSQAHAVSGDPMFVDPSADWHLQSASPALKAGTPVSMPAYGGGTIDVSHDMNGVLRTAPWDLGVYEQ